MDASSNVFQDFDVSRLRGANANAVHFVWADTFTNGSVRASIVTEPNEKYLRIWFENGIRSEEQGERAKGWASNVQIRPREQAALGNENSHGGLRYTALQFFARAPQEERKDGYIDEIGLSLRLLDRRLTYWVYRQAPRVNGPTQFRVATAEWQRFRVELSSEYYRIKAGDGNRWFLKFGSNGEPVPDFTVLPGITVVLGRFTAGREEPQEGKGVVDIKEITMTE